MIFLKFQQFKVSIEHCYNSQNDPLQSLLTMKYGKIGETVTNSETINIFGGNGSVFHLHFLGSVEIDEKGGRKRRKRLKKSMVEIAVTKIKVC